MKEKKMPVYVFSVLHFERSVAYSKTTKKRLPGDDQGALRKGGHSMDVFII